VWSSANWGNGNAVTPFSNMFSINIKHLFIDNNSRKLLLRCGCQYPWCVLALTVQISLLFLYMYFVV
jgi:hypothetical protein